MTLPYTAGQAAAVCVEEGEPDAEELDGMREFNENILESLEDGLVVFDEAYQPFSSRTWMPKLATHEHVLVLRKERLPQASRRRDSR